MADLAEIERLRAEVAAHEQSLEQKRLRLAVLAHEGFGVKGIRDPESPCTMFDPGDPPMFSFADCETDGHYLCDECTQRATCPGGCGKRPSRCECPEEPEEHP
jgi:hypothetical protein